MCKINPCLALADFLAFSGQAWAAFGVRGNASCSRWWSSLADFASRRSVPSSPKKDRLFSLVAANLSAVDENCAFRLLASSELITACSSRKSKSPTTRLSYQRRRWTSTLGIVWRARARVVRPLASHAVAQVFSASAEIWCEIRKRSRWQKNVCAQVLPCHAQQAAFIIPTAEPFPPNSDNHSPTLM